MKFNEFFKERRLKIGTVRQFAKQNGFDVAYISRLENGITTPPKDGEKLTKLGLCLGLTPGTAEWQEFTDLAAVAKNELPKDLQDNDHIAAVLPAFYRTLRNKNLDEKEAQKIIELIRNSFIESQSN